MLVPPSRNGGSAQLEIGPNIKPLPEFDPLPESLEGPVLLKVGDNISTDEIMPAGSRILPFRSNIPEISKFSFTRIDETFYNRALEYREKGYFILGGDNYGQGSSREHAVIGPRYLGLRVVLVRSFARIHRQNLINFGVLPLTFANKGDYDSIKQNDMLKIENLRHCVSNDNTLTIANKTRKETYTVFHSLNDRQIDIVLDGGLINVIRRKR
jgi:aconitate hydratase